MTVDSVLEKLWKAGVFTETDNDLIYVAVQDAVIAAVELDASLHQQVCVEDHIKHTLYQPQPYWPQYCPHWPHGISVLATHDVHISHMQYWCWQQLSTYCTGWAKKLDCIYKFVTPVYVDIE